MKFSARVEISTAKLRGRTKHAHIVQRDEPGKVEAYSNNPDEVTISLKVGDIMDKDDSASAYATFSFGDALRLVEKVEDIVNPAKTGIHAEALMLAGEVEQDMVDLALGARRMTREEAMKIDSLLSYIRTGRLTGGELKL